MAERGLTIGFIGLGWYPDIGGVESHTRDLARELAGRGHRLRALVLEGAEGLEPYSVARSEVEGVQVTRMAYRYHDHRALADLVARPPAEAAISKAGGAASSMGMRSMRSMRANAGTSARRRSAKRSSAAPHSRIRTPSPVLRTSPVRPSSVAIRQTVGRNPTP